MTSFCPLFSSFQVSTLQSGNFTVSFLYLKSLPVSHTVACKGPEHPCQPLQFYPMPPSSCAMLQFSFSSSYAMLPPALRAFHMPFSLIFQFIDSHSSFRAQFKCDFIMEAALEFPDEFPHFTFYSTSHSFLVCNYKSE